MRNYLKAVCVLAALAAAQLGFAQAPPAAPFQVHQLTSNIYWVEGGGGNSGVIVGSHGVIVIDAKMTMAGGKELLADIAKITTKPVTTVILTHSDADHVNGLVAFPKGLTIIAHENDLMEQQTALKEDDPRAPSADHLPNKIVTGDREGMDIDGVKLELLHWAPAHTSGDLVVYLPAQKIVFTGDIISTNFHGALIHQAKGGTTAGWMKTTQGILALKADRFVPGHGDVQNKQQIAQRLKDAEAERAQIKQLVAKGESLQQIEAAVGDPAPGTAAGNGPHFPSYCDVVYNELTGKAK